MQWVTPKLSEDVVLGLLLARQKFVDFCNDNFQLYYVDEGDNEATIVSVWIHFLLCCAELLLFAGFIFIIGRLFDFYLLGNGPLTVVINTAKILR